MTSQKANAAYIIAGEDGSVISKYTVNLSWTQSDDRPAIPMSCNINSDVAVPAFKSPEAPKRTLTMVYTPGNPPTGFVRFDGSIGDGLIHIKTLNGITIKGRIEGGPEDGQTFTGSGTWTRG